MLTRLRLLFADLCWHFNETANVSRATPTSYLHFQNTLYTLLVRRPSTAQRTRDRRLERTQHSKENRRLCFCFAYRPCKDFYCNFLISLRMFRRLCLPLPHAYVCMYVWNSHRAFRFDCRRLQFMAATTDKKNNKSDGKLLLRLHMWEGLPFQRHA